MRGTRDSRVTARLYDALEDLEYGATLEGVSRSEFIRRAIRERTRRLEDETTPREESDDAE